MPALLPPRWLLPPSEAAAKLDASLARAMADVL